MKIPKKYIDEIIKKYKDKSITPEMIKKDLALSYILHEIGKYREENESSPFHKLIFKGGTLLAKSHLDYHRISEDLDFTFKGNIKLNRLSSIQRIKKKRSFVEGELLPELNKICEKYNFDFSLNGISREEGREYFSGKDSKYLITLKIYINTEENNPIKIDINFCDELFYKSQQSKIVHLHPSSEHLIYPLENTQIESYDVREILLEKLRAIITRKERVNERDIYDLFLLFNLENNVFEVKHKDIYNKIIQGIGYNIDKKKEIDHILEIGRRLDELEDNLETEIKDMNLTDYNSEEYREFFEKLREFILGIDFEEL